MTKVPAIGILADLLAKGATKANKIKKSRAMERIARLVVDPTDCSVKAEEIAREVTLAKQNEINKLAVTTTEFGGEHPLPTPKGVVGRAKTAIKETKEKYKSFTQGTKLTPIEILAEKDVKTMMKYIMHGKLRETEDLIPQLLQVIKKIPTTSTLNLESLSVEETIITKATNVTASQSSSFFSVGTTQSDEENLEDKKTVLANPLQQKRYSDKVSKSELEAFIKQQEEENRRNREKLEEQERKSQENDKESQALKKN